MSYTNNATSQTQALVIFLLDVSGSMGKPMPGGKSRIEVVRAALLSTVEEMVQRSLKNKMLQPRYRLGMLAYSDDCFDLLDGIKSIGEVAKSGIPVIKPLNRTDTTKGFKHVRKMLKNDLSSWTSEQLHKCPAPLVIHMTDGEFTGSEDPEPIAREIQQMTVPDGNVLVENIYISDELKVANQEITQWPGYQIGDDIGNPYGNRLLAMSSLLPEQYRIEMGDLGYNIQPGTVMMYPGIRPEFVRAAFVMSTVTGGKNFSRSSSEKKWEDD
jgi:hypothetical protein